MAMVILSMAAAGVLLPFSGGARVQAEGIDSTLAAGLANDLMERIVATPYDGIVAFCATCDELQGQVTDSAGTPFASTIYARFSRDVVCERVTVWPQPETAVSHFLRVSVRVYDRGRLIVTLSRLIGEE